MKGLTSGLTRSGVEQLDRVEVRAFVCEHVLSDKFLRDADDGGLAVVIAIMALFVDLLS